MIIYSTPFNKKVLFEMLPHFFGDMVKGVVDIEKSPNQGNRSRTIEDPEIREAVKEVILSLCK